MPFQIPTCTAYAEDDILAANGMPNLSLVQKIFLAFTEGAVATGLLKAGGDNALGALQAVSICAGTVGTLNPKP
jgi:BCCT family betaine/carnitine transporter